MSTPQEKAILEAEAYKREIEKKQREAREPLKVEVSVDTTEIEKIAKQKAELELKLKQEDALTIKLKEDLREYNIDYEGTDFKNMNEVTPLIVALKEAKDAQNRKPPSGSVPLQGQISQESDDEFSSYEEMIDFIRDKSHEPQGSEAQKEAEMILDALWKKALQYGEDTNKPITISQKEKGLVEEINERFRRRKKRD